MRHIAAGRRITKSEGLQGVNIPAPGQGVDCIALYIRMRHAFIFNICRCLHNMNGFRLAASDSSADSFEWSQSAGYLPVMQTFKFSRRSIAWACRSCSGVS